MLATLSAAFLAVASALFKAFLLAAVAVLEARAAALSTLASAASNFFLPSASSFSAFKRAASAFATTVSFALLTAELADVFFALTLAIRLSLQNFGQKSASSPTRIHPRLIGTIT